MEMFRSDSSSGHLVLSGNPCRSFKDTLTSSSIWNYSQVHSRGPSPWKTANGYLFLSFFQPYPSLSLNPVSTPSTYHLRPMVLCTFPVDIDAPYCFPTLTVAFWVQALSFPFPQLLAQGLIVLSALLALLRW